MWEIKMTLKPTWSNQRTPKQQRLWLVSDDYYVVCLFCCSFPLNNTEDPGFGPCKYSIQRVWISDHLGRLVCSRVVLGCRSGCGVCLTLPPSHCCQHRACGHCSCVGRNCSVLLPAFRSHLKPLSGQNT